MRDFKGLLIWQRGFQIAKNCFEIIRKFPPEEKYGLVSQISRAGVSIPSNIAEGSGRVSLKEFNNFIHISMGSSFELETHLLIAQHLNYGDKNLITSTLDLLIQEQKMLQSFSNNLKAQILKSRV